jgi:hypothetical protein
MMNRSQIEKMLMASGGITGEPVQTARLGSYMSSTGGGQGGPAGMTTTERKRQAPVVKANTADRQLNNLVIKSRNDERYRNEQGAGMNYNTAYDLAPASAKKFVDEQMKKTGGRLNEAAKARLNSYLTNRTQYQLDLDKFRKASPENEAAYVRRFPKTAAFEKMLRKGAEGLIGTPGRIIKNLADNYLDGVKNMVEKISGVDAKNVEIAKDKDTDIDTIVNNLQRNIKEERDDGKARGMTEADLTAMYGDPIDITTGDDIFGAELIGMDELEEDSPLRQDDVAPDPFPRADVTGRAEDVAPDPFPRADVTGREEDVAPGFDLTAPDNLVDLSGTSGRLEEPNAIDPQQELEDRGKLVNTGDFVFPGRLPTDQFPVNFEGSFFGGGDDRSTYDDFQDPETFGPGRAPTFLERPFEFLPFYESLGDLDFSPAPDSKIRDPETFNTRADGGEIFGNQNMSTFDKLKAIADGIADNK